MKTGQKILTPANAVNELERKFRFVEGSIRRTILERMYCETTGYYPNSDMQEAKLFAQALHDFAKRLRKFPSDPYQAFRRFLQHSRNVRQIKAYHLRMSLLWGYGHILSHLQVRRNVMNHLLTEYGEDDDKREMNAARMEIVKKVRHALRENWFRDEDLQILENIRVLLDGNETEEESGYAMLRLIRFGENGKPVVPDELRSMSDPKKTGSKKRGGKGNKGSPSNPPAGSGSSGTPVPGLPGGSRAAPVNSISGLAYMGHMSSCVPNCAVMRTALAPFANIMAVPAVL